MQDPDLINLEVLEVGESNNEQALVDLQLSLAAYTQVVIKNLSDSIPKQVYAQLIGKVCTSLNCFDWYYEPGKSIEPSCKNWLNTWELLQSMLTMHIHHTTASSLQVPPRLPTMPANLDWQQVTTPDCWHWSSASTTPPAN